MAAVSTTTTTTTTTSSSSSSTTTTTNTASSATNATTIDASGRVKGLKEMTPSGPITRVSALSALSSDSLKTLDRIVVPVNTSDGAGVRLRRSVGSSKLRELDPFLLLDEFKSDDPRDYKAGFPTHPHRGFETVTLMLHGHFKHQDSKGNTGLLTSGGVQWMTAGRGVRHSETPMQADGLMWGYQLWVNLPAAKKMVEPRYQDIEHDRIPTIALDNGSSFRLIAGHVDELKLSGPVDAVSIQPTLLDVSLPPNTPFQFPIPQGHTLFLYTVEGDLNIITEGNTVRADASRLVIFSNQGQGFQVASPSNSHSRFLVVSGAPINEPIARQGPFVMNTQQEIEQCFTDLFAGVL